MPRTLTRRAFALGTTSTLASAALFGCGNNGSQAAQTQDEAAGTEVDAARQVTVAMSTSNEPEAGFNPCVNWGCGEHVHEPLIQSTLIVTDTDMNFVGDLATSWSCSDDKLTWTFTLRDGVVFSDGEPLTASDVAFTANTIISSPNAEADLSMVDEAVAVDDATVEFRLNKPCNTLLYTLAVMGIVPEHAYGDDYGQAPIGSGRYLLAQWDKGQQAIFEANPSYYGDAPNIERIVVVFMEEDAALAAAQAGEVDVAYTSATYAAQSVEGYSLESYETVDSRGINLPVIASGATRTDGEATYAAGNDITCKLEVRRAINYATDRQAIVDDVLNGCGTPAFSVGDGMPWASEDMRCERDLAYARQLLEQAGWERPDESGTYERDGVACALDLWYPSGDSVRQAMAAAFANQMAEAGIAVSLHGGSWDELYQHQYSDPIMWGWGSNSPSDVYELNHSAGTMNFSCYASDATDVYLDAALAASTVEESYPLWQQAEWDGTDGIAPQGQATWVWLANVDHLYWVRDGLSVAAQKLQPHGHGWSILNNVDSWSWT